MNTSRSYSALWYHTFLYPQTFRQPADCLWVLRSWTLCEAQETLLGYKRKMAKSKKWMNGAISLSLPDSLHRLHRSTKCAVGISRHCKRPKINMAKNFISGTDQWQELIVNEIPLHELASFIHPPGLHVSGWIFNEALVKELHRLFYESHLQVKYHSISDLTIPSLNILILVVWWSQLKRR